MIKINNLSYAYGKIQALRDINFEVEKGSICAIIGSNGAGKSTLMKCIGGFLKVQEGSIEYLGKKLPDVTHRVIREGIALIPEGRWVFPQLSVSENLRIGAYTVSSDIERRNFEKVYNVFPILHKRKDQRAGTLSGGEQQMLVIGRALMCNPKLLLMDEPSLGLAPLIINEVFRIIRTINDQGVTIILVEQNAKKALAIADNAILLETGRIKKKGSGHELSKDEVIISTYLGGSRRND